MSLDLTEYGRILTKAELCFCAACANVRGNRIILPLYWVFVQAKKKHRLPVTFPFVLFSPFMLMVQPGISNFCVIAASSRLMEHLRDRPQNCSSSHTGHFPLLLLSIKDKSHTLSLSSLHESAKSCRRVTIRALGKESGASCQSISWWFTFFLYVSVSSRRNRPAKSIYLFAFYRTGCKKEMLSCSTRRVDLFPFSWCKKIPQFLWLLSQDLH